MGSKAQVGVKLYSYVGQQADAEISGSSVGKLVEHTRYVRSVSVRPPVSVASKPKEKHLSIGGGFELTKVATLTTIRTWKLAQAEYRKQISQHPTSTPDWTRNDEI